MSLTASLSIVANKVVALSVITGANGLSAYQLALANGFEGNRDSWLASLVGSKGDKGDTGETGAAGSDAFVTEENIAAALGFTPVNFDPTADPFFSNGLTAGLANALGIDGFGNLGTNGYVGASNGIFTDNSGLNPDGSIYGLSLTLPNATALKVGSFDNGTGGANGIGLLCAIGYELNYQGGRLRNIVQGDTTGNPVELYIDSPIYAPSINFGAGNNLYDDGGLYYGFSQIALVGSNISNFVNDYGYSTFYPAGTVAYQGDNISEFNNDAGYITSSGNPFDQSLNTTDSPTFVEASFAFGALTIDQYGSLYASNIDSWGNLNASSINAGGLAIGATMLLYSDGSASFADGSATIDIYGNISALGLRANGDLFVSRYGSGGWWVGPDGGGSWAGGISSFDPYGGITLGGVYGYGPTSLFPDGSASFASGAATIDASGNAALAGLTVGGVPVGGNPFDQSLNTTDSPTFSNITLGYNGGITDGYFTLSDNGLNVGGGDMRGATCTGDTGSWWLAEDGSASFANGNATFNWSGNLSLFSITTTLLDVIPSGWVGPMFSVNSYEGVFVSGDNGGAVTFGSSGAYSKLQADGSISVCNGAATIDASGVLAIANPVSTSTDNVVTNKVEIVIGGVTYYLLATTDAS